MSCTQHKRSDHRPGSLSASKSTVEAGGYHRSFCLACSPRRPKAMPFSNSQHKRLDHHAFAKTCEQVDTQCSVRSINLQPTCLLTGSGPVLRRKSARATMLFPRNLSDATVGKAKMPFSIATCRGNTTRSSRNVVNAAQTLGPSHTAPQKSGTLSLRISRSGLLAQRISLPPPRMRSFTSEMLEPPTLCLKDWAPCEPWVVDQPSYMAHISPTTLPPHPTASIHIKNAWTTANSHQGPVLSHISCQGLPEWRESLSSACSTWLGGPGSK